MREAESREQLCMVGGGPCLEPLVHQRVWLCSHQRESHRSTSLSTGKVRGWYPRVGQCPSLLPCQERCKGAAFYSSLLDSWLLGDR